MFFMFASMLFPMPASTAEVAGILVPDESKVAGFDGVLLLKGAEVLEKFFVEVYLDYIPGDATEVSENGVSVGMIDGRDFNSALLGVWLGEAPATESLKKAMVGVDKQ
jgi:hypothetical protein